jgi:FkbM family methyltransferase
MASLCYQLARHRRTAILRWAAGKCRRYLECYENFRNYDFRRNGEARVLQALAGEDFRCIFDAGANVGDWTALALDRFPAAQIHCFEVLEETARKLEDRMHHRSNVIVNAVGLADAEREVTLKCFPGASALTSIYDAPHDLPSHAARGRLMAGETYLRDRGIEHVDYLKIDVEGAEHLVLQGLAPALERGAVDVIQFEYGQGSIITKFLLRDFYAFLQPLGYRLGKIYPNHVEFRDYEFAHEDFLGPNFLAVRAQRDDLIAKLG